MNYFISTVYFFGFVLCKYIAHCFIIITCILHNQTSSLADLIPYFKHALVSWITSIFVHCIHHNNNTNSLSFNLDTHILTKGINKHPKFINSELSFLIYTIETLLAMLNTKRNCKIWTGKAKQYMYLKLI